METINYSEARQNLSETIAKVCDDRKPIRIKRRSKDGRIHEVIMIAADDYEAMDETAYLMRSPAMAARLRESIAAADRGEFAEGARLIDPDELDDIDDA